MPRRAPRSRRSDCPISITLELLGDEWSLLVVRDLMFKGLRTFQEFANSGEGIASNVLAERLARLEAGGIVSRERDAEDRRRVLYRLTEKGIDLAPVMVEIVLWAARHERTGAPEATVAAMRHHREGFLAEIRQRWEATAGAQSPDSPLRPSPESS
ncbi:MAG: helix-turn-helix domain-containing protein [Thermoanaerobaculia bacterium]